MAVLGLVSLGPPAQAEEHQLLQQTHAWGRFGKGSWREVQILTENFDEQGALTNSSTTDNKTTVEDVTPERVTLRIEVTVEIAGQKFPSQPQIIKQGYAGENVGQSVSIKPLSHEVLVVDDREIPCETQQIEIVGGVSKEVSIISYSPRLRPTILKRKSILSDVASARTTQESVSEVYALDRRLNVLGENKTGFRVRLVQKNDRGTTTTRSVHVLDVPGEVVSHTSEKLDPKGRLVRRSTLELVAYSVEEDDSVRDGSRGRMRRHKRGRDSR
jgi:hypothetical protein